MMPNSKKTHNKNQYNSYFPETNAIVRDVQYPLSRFDRFILDALHRCSVTPQLIHAPAATGKTTRITKSAPHTHPITYLAPRDDLKQQAKEIAQQEGHSVAILPSAVKLCPAFNPTSVLHEPEAVELWQHGATPSFIHHELDLHSGIDTCEYEQRYDEITTRVEDIDLLIGDPLHAYLDISTTNRLVVFDELPLHRFAQTFEDVPQQVTKWLKSNPYPGLLPDRLSTWGDVLQLRGTDEGDAIAKMLRGLWSIPEEEVKEANPRFHRNAALFLYAVVGGKPVGADYSLAQLGFNRLVFDKSSDEVMLFERPRFHDALGVVGLDATPRFPLWNLLLPPETEFECQALFDPDSHEWDTYHHHPKFLNLTLRQLGKAVKPYDGSNQSLKRDEGVFRYIAKKEGTIPDLITTEAALRAYRQNELDSLYAAALNYRGVRSSNQFGGVNHTVGVLQGSPHPGDDVIKRWCAMLDEPTNITGSGKSKNYGSEVANAVARHFTSDLVYHAIMRFVRGSAPATVYVNTTAANEWLSPKKSLLNEFDNNWQSYTGVKPAIRIHLQQHGDSTITDLAEATNYSKSRVREGVNELDADTDSPIERRDRPGAKSDAVVRNE